MPPTYKQQCQPQGAAYSASTMSRGLREKVKEEGPKPGKRHRDFFGDGFEAGIQSTSSLPVFHLHFRVGRVVRMEEKYLLLTLQELQMDG